MFKLINNNYIDLITILDQDEIILTKFNKKLIEFNKFKLVNDILTIETYIFKDNIKSYYINSINKSNKKNIFKVCNKLNHFIIILEINDLITYYYINNKIIYQKKTNLIPYFIKEEYNEKILNYYFDIINENKITISRIILDYDNTLISIDDVKYNNKFNLCNIINPIYIDFFYSIKDPNLFILDQKKENNIIKNNIWLEFNIKTKFIDNIKKIFITEIYYKNNLISNFQTYSSPTFIIIDNIFSYIDNNKLYNIKNKLILECINSINSFFIFNNKLYIIDNDIYIYEQLIDELIINRFFLNDVNNDVNIYSNNNVNNDSNNNDDKLNIIINNRLNQQLSKINSLINKKNYDEELEELNNYINENFQLINNKIIKLFKLIDVNFEDINNVKELKNDLLTKFNELNQDFLIINELIINNKDNIIINRDYI